MEPLHAQINTGGGLITLTRDAMHYAIDPLGEVRNVAKLWYMAALYQP